LRWNWLNCVRGFVKHAEKNVRKMIMIIFKNLPMPALTVQKSVKKSHKQKQVFHRQRELKESSKRIIMSGIKKKRDGSCFYTDRLFF
jgi:hypothetical protein